MKDVVTLRTATLDDLRLMQSWDEQAHIVASDPNDDWRWETELGRSVPWREQLIAELNGRPIGYLEIIDPALDEEHYWGEIGGGFRAIDIWIGEPDCLAQGYGTRMMRLALERCFRESEVKAVLVDPISENFRAHRFYERLGFKCVERRRFGQDECMVYCLDRTAYERAVEGLGE